MLFVGIQLQRQGDEPKKQLLQRATDFATSISPQWMVWESNSEVCSLLVNLEVTESYWKTQLQKKYGIDTKQTWHVLFKQFLHEFLTSGFEDASGDTRAVLATHPWQCVLMLEHMQQKSLSGVYLLSESFAQGGSWWKSIHMLSTHWENASSVSKNIDQSAAILGVDHCIDGKAFDGRSWQRSVERLSRACQVLDRSTPYQAFVLGKASLARRYGKRLSRVMQWSFDCSKQQVLGLFEHASLQGFPWKSYAQPMDIVVERNLEHPVFNWEQCRPALEEDLSQLGTHPLVDVNLYVLSLEWRLTFSDMSLTTVPVPFRHPTQICYASCQKAAVTQAYYTFEDMQNKLQEASPRTEDLFVEPKSVIRWELSVSKKMRSLHSMARFLESGKSDDSSSQDDLERLQAVESQLPVALQEYDLRADWFYQDSYAQTKNCDQEKLSVDWLPALEAAASVRPLYIFDRPQKLQRAKNTGALWKFQERVMDKWWSLIGRKEKTNQTQNFYKFISTDGNQLWVSQGSERDLSPWMVYGIYA